MLVYGRGISLLTGIFKDSLPPFLIARTIARVKFNHNTTLNMLVLTMEERHYSPKELQEFASMFP